MTPASGSQIQIRIVLRQSVDLFADGSDAGAVIVVVPEHEVDASREPHEEVLEIVRKSVRVADVPGDHEGIEIGVVQVPDERGESRGPRGVEVNVRGPRESHGSIIPCDSPPGQCLTAPCTPPRTGPGTRSIGREPPPPESVWHLPVTAAERMVLGQDERVRLQHLALADEDVDGRHHRSAVRPAAYS